MRKQIIAGNWKMYQTPSQGKALLEELCPLMQDISSQETVVVVCPPATGLAAAQEVLSSRQSQMKLGAQNLHHQPEGAYTGEIAANMLTDLGVQYVICGHSERRQYFGETDSLISQKAAAAIQNGLIPIICVGESQAQKEAGQTLEWIEQQIKGSLAFWDGKQPLVIAYEPIWAIGTGLTATAAEAEKVSAFIRQTIGRLWGEPAAETTAILYGGSVKPANIKELMAQPNIDGALVGGASLKADSFAQIAHFNCETKEKS